MVQNIKDKSNEFASKTDENGAKGVIFDNTKKRLFDAIGTAEGITIPVVAVAISAREKLTDGAVCEC